MTEQLPTFKTPKGHMVRVHGDPALLTMDRMAVIGDHFDSDPRIVSVSLQYHPEHDQTFLRATAPAGVVIAVCPNDLVDPDLELDVWASKTSDRGLWHDWILTNARDIKAAEIIKEPSEVDLQERKDPTGSHYEAFNKSTIDPNNLTLTIDVTWLGPHETGAQVLTTAAVPAIADQPSIKSIRLVGLKELPDYAQHLTDHPKVTLATTPEQLDEQTDIMWYPNQIDQRVDISQARKLGKRVITTYLDLIAYDIPKYHATTEDWLAYRAMQRTIALSVDGITTISKDVAKRLYQEVPTVDLKRIKAIPLGLNHITLSTEQQRPNELKNTGRPFVLVLGNDFQHKNRDFAIDVWQEVLNQGISVDLVLAGLHVRGSSSNQSETNKLKKHTNLRGEAHTLGHVTSGQRVWLLANASAVLYPSSAEGFGFVPYEAAIFGTPTTFTSFGPLKEISQVTTTPINWSATQVAQDLTALLASEQRASNRVTQLHQVVQVSNWNGFAQELLDFFSKIATAPTVPTGTADTNMGEAQPNKTLFNRAKRAIAPIRKLHKNLN
jgi:glycosyltransferase involved in cell wall biosynthesis